VQPAWAAGEGGEQTPPDFVGETSLAVKPQPLEKRIKAARLANRKGFSSDQQRNETLKPVLMDHIHLNHT